MNAVSNEVKKSNKITQWRSRRVSIELPEGVGRESESSTGGGFKSNGGGFSGALWNG